MTAFNFRQVVSIAGTMLLCGLSLYSPDALAQARTAPPVDEASQDPTLVEFREKLLEAVVRRDVDYVVSQASSSISLKPGRSDRRDAFRSLLAAPAAHASWDALEDMLRMGGRFTGEGVFEAPYTATIGVSETIDEATRVVIGRDVPLLERPSRYGKVLATLDFHIVTALDSEESADFVEVKVMDDVSGYVARRYLRNPSETRVRLEKREGQWRLTSFFAASPPAGPTVSQPAVVEQRSCVASYQEPVCDEACNTTTGWRGKEREACLVGCAYGGLACKSK